MPKISVIMSVYKEPIDWLHQSIDSILNQTFKDFEFIIICDNPEYKEGIDLLEEYRKRDGRIVIIYNEQNIGLTKSLNKGLSIARGEYIARMDADDISLPNRFEKQILYMDKHQKIDLCHTNYAFIDETGTIKCKSVSSLKTSTQDFLFWHNVIAHPSVIFRRKVLEIRQPLYNEEIRIGQDYELWTFLTVERFTFGFVDEVLLNYRISTKQISTNKLEEQHKNTLRIRNNFIISFLRKNAIINETNSIDVIQLFNDVLLHIESNKLSETTDTSYLIRILYILYYTLACKDVKYVFLFFTDKYMNHIPLKLKDKIRIVIAPILGWKYEAMKFD